MSRETRRLHDDVTYIPNAGNDDFGNITVDTSAIEGRRARIETTKGVVPNAFGQPVEYDVKLILDQDVELKDLFWLGLIDDFVYGTSTGLYQVIGYRKTADAKGRRYRRQAFLASYTQTTYPPTV